MEYLCLLAEIESLKDQAKKPGKVPCPGVTGKGVPCKRYCASGLETCKIHDRPPKSVCVGLNTRGTSCKKKCVDGQAWCEMHDPSLPRKQKIKKVVYEPIVVDAKWVDERTFWERRNEPVMI
jgi:hypothetical protein